MDEWAAIDTERGALADDLATLTDAQWDAPSLCAEWRVRDVVAHLVMGTEISIGGALGGLARNGFSFNRFMARSAIAAAEGTSPQDLLARLRATVGNRSKPPGTKPLDVLTDVTCHSQDVRRPLGLSRAFPEATMTAVADRLKGTGFPFGTKKRVAGLCLRATDVPWTHGEGPEVSGTLEALVMMMGGRRAALDDLAGPGLDELRARGA